MRKAGPTTPTTVRPTPRRSTRPSAVRRSATTGPRRRPGEYVTSSSTSWTMGLLLAVYITAGSIDDARAALELFGSYAAYGSGKLELVQGTTSITIMSCTTE